MEEAINGRLNIVYPIPVLALVAPVMAQWRRDYLSESSVSIHKYGEKDCINYIVYTQVVLISR
jgi:hypothetical protein